MNRKELILPILACLLAVLFAIFVGARLIAVREAICSACVILWIF